MMRNNTKFTGMEPLGIVRKIRYRPHRVRDIRTRQGILRFVNKYNNEKYKFFENKKL